MTYADGFRAGLVAAAMAVDAYRAETTSYDVSLRHAAKRIRALTPPPAEAAPLTCEHGRTGGMCPHCMGINAPQASVQPATLVNDLWQNDVNQLRELRAKLAEANSKADMLASKLVEVTKALDFSKAEFQVANAQLAANQAREVELRRALTMLSAAHGCNCSFETGCPHTIARTALNAPADDSALREFGRKVALRDREDVPHEQDPVAVVDAVLRGTP